MPNSSLPKPLHVFLPLSGMASFPCHPPMPIFSWLEPAHPLNPSILVTASERPSAVLAPQEVLFPVPCCCCQVVSLALCNPVDCSTQASLSFTISWILLKPTSVESVMPSSHLILCRPFSSCPQSFPASGSFPMSWFFTSGGQSTGASTSASVLPVNIQG